MISWLVKMVGPIDNTRANHRRVISSCHRSKPLQRAVAWVLLRGDHGWSEYFAHVCMHAALKVDIHTSTLTFAAEVENAWKRSGYLFAHEKCFEKQSYGGGINSIFCLCTDRHNLYVILRTACNIKSTLSVNVEGALAYEPSTYMRDIFWVLYLV